MKTILRSLFVSVFLLSFLYVSAQPIDTVSVYSHKMGIDVKNLVILPKNYNVNQTYPVLYLLHGHGGNHISWARIKPSLPEEASRYNMIIVCPDGKNSWYWDSPINSKSQFETYVSKELVEYMDKTYSTVKSNKGRAITGFSMGGHGGLWLGIRHQDVFGACGSMSGGVDIRPFPNNWNMKNLLGSYNENPNYWNEHTVMNLVKLIKPSTANIIIDCGVDDFFFDVNERLHRELMLNKIPHDYIVRPGAHNGAYWNNAVDYQILYFSKYFNKK
ncbi:esterase family protein [Dysgonomonas sp. 216]|uniref:alpha/beta hydrolase n=1 Tax=Dysgonomonas sp. 216 TaxID=2302934 RepID=UPI0013D12776|nr:alpha/beta hydrolase family protein [Dysgonomonas sp. 216]NDW17672.1 esterase family protein [Dysgonomonas sp. 216]